MIYGEKVRLCCSAYKFEDLFLYTLEELEEIFKAYQERERRKEGGMVNGSSVCCAHDVAALQEPSASGEGVAVPVVEKEGSEADHSDPL